LSRKKCVSIKKYMDIWFDSAKFIQFNRFFVNKWR
jgi:hypothetical protein